MRMMSKLPTTTGDCGKLETIAVKLLAPIHPDEILRDEFTIPKGFSGPCWLVRSAEHME